MGGGGEQSGRARPGAKAKGRERTGASRGRGGEWDDGSAGVEGFVGLFIVLMPPPGVGGGGEQSGRARPGAKAMGRERTGASRGRGGGRDARRGDIQRL